MQSMVATLEHLTLHCHGDHRPDCPILEDLARRDDVVGKDTLERRA